MATLLMIESWLRSTGEALPALVRAMGHDYVLLTRDPDLYGTGTGTGRHPVVAEATEVVVAETNHHAAVADAAAAVAEHRPVAGVLTTCDYYLAAVAHAAGRLGLPGAAPEVMARAVRKDLVRADVAAAGVPDARHAAVTSWHEARSVAARLGYPLVAKPVDLNAGTSVRRVEDEAQLEAAHAEITAPVANSRGQGRAPVVLLEEVLVGTEVSVECVTVEGDTTVLGVTDKSVTGAPGFVESGHMFPAALPEGDVAVAADHALRVLDAVGITHGLTHTEVMLTDDGPRLVELNPRQAGGHIFDLVHLVTGTHPLRLLVELALGAPSPPGTAGAPLAGAVAGSGSAAVVFVMSPCAGEVVAVDGADRWDADPWVHRWTLPLPARAVRPVDNEGYLGHLLVVDRSGADAREHAARLVDGARLRLADGRTVRPVAVDATTGADLVHQTA